MTARFQNARSTRTTKRGLYFTLDAIFAAVLITSALLFILAMRPVPQSPRALDTTARDAVTILNTLTVGELNVPTATIAIATNLTTANDTVMRAIGVLWATNNSIAPNFTRDVFATFLPKMSYGVYIESTYLAGNETQPQSNAPYVATAKQQVSGIAFNQPVSGTTATALLKKYQNRTTSSFVTFGGFDGQGNLTFTLADLPSDLTASSIVDVTLEVDAPTSFTLYVNSFNCGDYNPTAAGNNTVSSWEVLGCNNRFLPGNNMIEMRFNDSIDNDYISGGFLKVHYITNAATPLPYESPITVHLPGIQGIVNLYDAFTTPGNVTSLTLTLHYITNRSNISMGNTFYVTIGNTTVYTDNVTNGTQFVVLNDANLTPILNYSTLANRTVPIRIGFTNLSFSTVFSGNVNAMMVTDTSGSMDWVFYQDNLAGTKRECGDAQINNTNTQRLSFAKCLDKQFAADILNVSGNALGLISYNDVTENGETVPLTTNTTLINQTIGNTTAGYVASGSTCICCGVNSAVTELNKNVLKTTFLANGSNWFYLFKNSSTQAPDNDSGGNSWYASTYTNESTWNNGSAVLGSAENGTGPSIVTDMGNSVTSVQFAPNLWPMYVDNASWPYVNFATGMNSTGNTFGRGGANDGWDSQAGTYGFGNQVGFPGGVGGWIAMDFNTSPSNQNNCGGNGCSGAYGVTVNITPELWSAISSNGTARLAFTYAWTPGPGNPFSGTDATWIKARWTDTTNTITNLGTEVSSKGGDSTPEVSYRTNPDVSYNGTYTVDITGLINGAGIYYLDFGGKMYGRQSTKWGRFKFTNVLIGISNSTDVYYLRANFTINNLSQIQTGVLNLLSDDRATVYLNGNLLLDEGIEHNAQQWNVRGFLIPQGNFVSGRNEIAVRIENLRGAAKFDMRIDGLNTTRTLAMLLMTDGQANQECNQQNTGDATQDAILAACQAKELWGITVHTVGFAATADTDALSSMAACTGGLFTSSSDTLTLANFFSTVAIAILDSSLRSQGIVTQGSYNVSTLFPDSSISISHTGAPPALQSNEIALTTQSYPFGSCNPTVTINPNARVLGARLASYSGAHWTDFVSANGVPIYNLSQYNVPYILLGDPYIIAIPPSVLVPGVNTLFVNTGDAPGNSSGCSVNDTLITDLAIKLSPAYTPVVTNAVGCTWNVENDAGTFQTINVPRTYSGANTCSYTNASISYSASDAYDVAAYGLLSSLDYDHDGRIFISLSDADVEIIVNTVSNVPYLWGPSLVEVRVWQ